MDSIEGSGFYEQFLEENGEIELTMDTIRGTWVRDGDTLTLNDDDGETITLKKT